MVRFRPLAKLVIMTLVALSFVGLGVDSHAMVALEELPAARRAELGEQFRLILAAQETQEALDTVEAEMAEVRAQKQQRLARIAGAEETYADARERTVTALRWIHRRGVTSYFEVVVGASSLREVLRRAEVARLAARGALRTLDEVRSEKMALDELRDEVAVLRDELAALETRRAELAEAPEAVASGAEALAEVHGADWPQIEEELYRLTGLWRDATEPYLQRLPERFSAIAEREVEPEGVSVSLSGFSVWVTVPAEGLTALLTGEPGLENTEFQFEPDAAVLLDRTHRIQVRGTLDIDRFGVVHYSVVEMEFAGMPIDDPALIEAVDGLELDLGPALGGMRPQRLVLEEGAIVLVLSFLY